MFRPLRRKSRALPHEAAKELLKNGRRAVLAVNGDEGYPFALPINYLYDEAAGRIFFHGAKSGHKVDALNRSNKVCFIVYGNEHHKEGEWAPYVQSTVVFGRCRLVDDPATTAERVRELALKYYPSIEEVDAVMSKEIAGVQLFEIEIEHLTGKQIKEK